MFEKYNVEQLSYSIVDLLLNEKKRIALSEQAREDYVNRYSLDAIYGALYEKYINIIRQHRSCELFEKERYAEMISEAENIKLDEANRIVDQLLESIYEKKYVENKNIRSVQRGINLQEIYICLLKKEILKLHIK